MQTSNPAARQNRFSLGRASAVCALVVLILSLLGALLYALILLAAKSGLFLFSAVLLLELGILGIGCIGTPVAAVGLLLGIVGLLRGNAERRHLLVGIAINGAALGAVCLYALFQQ
jgi:hypothetical protein